MLACLGVAAQAARDLEPVDARQADVEDRDVRPVLLRSARAPPRRSPRSRHSKPALASSSHSISRLSALSSTTTIVARSRSGRADSRARPAIRLPRGVGPAAARTTNSLPRPSPSLCAVTVPPCIATSERTSVRPTPSPPAARSSVRLDCTNRSNTESSMFARNAGAVVAHADHGVAVASRRRSSSTWPPLGVYLAALLSRLTWICCSRAGSPST